MPYRENRTCMVDTFLAEIPLDPGLPELHSARDAAWNEFLHARVSAVVETQTYMATPRRRNGIC